MSKKPKKLIPKDKLRAILPYIRVSSVYLDNAILGYKTDNEREDKCVKLLLKYIKKRDIQTFISFVTVSEIRPLFIGEISKIKPKLKKKFVEAAEEFKPVVIELKETIKILKNNKSFFEFLKKIGIKEYDAAHFTLTVFSNIDLFISFNKRIFKDKQNKIKKELMRYNRKMPYVWSIDDIEDIMKKLEEINFI